MYHKINNILEDALLIDVRTKQEYLINHLDDSINIPYQNIVSILHIEPNKERKIIVYCKEGKRSYKAAISLINLGYKNVYDLDAKKISF